MTGDHTARDDNAIAGQVFIAPAKINLSLKVLGRRHDGYHELESVVAFAPNVADRLNAKPAATAAVRVTGPFSKALNPGDNLITAAMARAKQYAPELKLADISLEKVIPVAAGLGGGSADAAATLLALQTLNSGHSQEVDWAEVARELGADVPVCLTHRASVMRGIGETITPLAGFTTLHAVLVNACANTPTDKTARVFARLDAQPLDEHRDSGAQTPSIEERLSACTTPEAVIRELRHEQNDLERPAIAIMPEIADVKAVLNGSPACLLARMSGAGPTVFGLYASAYDAKNAADDIRTNHATWWVAETTLK